MKDVTTEQVLEIINKEFDLFNKRSLAAMDELSSKMNNITIDQVQKHVAKALVKKEVPNILLGYAALASCYVTIQQLIHNHRSEN